jgi:hypothetical protein
MIIYGIMDLSLRLKVVVQILETIVFYAVEDRTPRL